MSRRTRKSKSSSGAAPKELKNMKIKQGSLINSIFLHASSLPQKYTLNVLWDKHKQIDDVLSQLIQLESELKVPLPHRNESDIINMENWAKKSGVEMHKSSIAEFLEYGYGLQATNAIKQGDTVISIPKKLMMTVECIKGSPMESLYEKDVFLQQLPNLALAIFLLVERFRTDKPSFWLPYIAALPKSYSTCMYFSIDDLTQLRGSPAFEYSLKMCNSMAKQYSYFWSIFQKNNDEASNILRDVFTYEQYRWAVSTVMTRQNYVAGAGNVPVDVIIPVWDFCNHANNKEKSAEKSSLYCVETERCECTAHRDFAAGDPITIFYGERSNADFLVHNGFVYPENHHDCVKIKFGISNSDAYLLRMGLLKKLKLPASGEYLITCDKQNPIHSHLLAFLRIFKMTEDQLQHWMENDIDCVEDTLLGPVGTMDSVFELQVLEYLQTRIDLLLKSYRTTLEEDERILQEEELTPIRKLIVMLRITEKKILKSTSIFCSLKTSELKLEEIEVN